MFDTDNEQAQTHQAEEYEQYLFFHRNKLNIQKSEIPKGDRQPAEEKK